MQLIDILTSPWAILPSKLLEIQAIYAAHLRGEKIDIGAIEARMGRPLANEQQTYEVRAGGVAVLPLEGVMARKANLFMQVSGGASTQMLVQQINSLRADSRVRSVVLAVDSPGGHVHGVTEAGDALRALAGEKPVVAVAEGDMASAAYWVASAASALYVSGRTEQVGSIGVYARLGWNPRDEHSVEMVRGKFKRLALNGQSPDPQVLAHYDGMLDHLYSAFVETVATHRGVSVDTVLERMADGRVFVGQQAIDAGLVDGMSTVDAIVEQLATDPSRFARRRVAKPKALAAVSASVEDPELDAAGAADESATTTTLETERTVMPNPADTVITAEALERDHPALWASLRTRFHAEGVAAERARIQAVRAHSLPGHEALIERLAMDGQTSGDQAAAAVLAAERTAREAALAAHRADAPPAAPGSAAPADPSASDAKSGKSRSAKSIAASAVALLRGTRNPAEEGA